jgi:hypothetical protein
MVRRRTAPRKKRAAYAKLESAAPARRSGALVILVLGALVLLNLYVFVWDKKTSVSAIKQQALAGSAGTSMTIQTAPLAAPAPVPAETVTAVDGHVAKSDTLGKLLKRSGLSAAEADDVIRALSGVLDFRTIRAGAAFHIERGPDGKIARFDLELPPNHHVRVERTANGGLTGSSDPI